MAKQYLKQWRKYRQLTQDQVVDRLALFDDEHLPQTAASLSRIENGKQPYGQRILEALADVYQCEPDHLIGRDPTKAGEVIDLWGRLSESQRGIARAMIDEMAKQAG